MQNQLQTEAWFASLYRDHAKNVLGFLVRLCHGDRGRAEDLTQETFVAAYQGRDSFGGRGSPRAWLLGIALRRWRDRNRRHQVPSLPLLEEDELVARGSLEDGCIARLTLDQALAILEQRHREALLLVVSQGLTYREAATLLEEPLGTVKWRVHEATRQLRNHLIALEKNAENAENEDNEEATHETVQKSSKAAAAPGEPTHCGHGRA